MSDNKENSNVLSPLSNDFLIDIAVLCIPNCDESRLLNLSVNNPRVFGIISDFANLVNYVRQGGKL